jgi:hypothetical protein
MGHNIEDHAIQKFGKVAREMLGGWCDKKTDASGLTPMFMRPSGHRPGRQFR